MRLNPRFFRKFIKKKSNFSTDIISAKLLVPSGNEYVLNHYKKKLVKNIILGSNIYKFLLQIKYIFNHIIFFFVTFFPIVYKSY